MMKNSIKYLIIFFVIISSACVQKEKELVKKISINLKDQTIFPADYPEPDLKWKSKSQEWVIEVTANGKAEKIKTNRKKWQFSEELWNRVKRNKEKIRVKITGYINNKINDRGEIGFKVSKDSVKSPIFYRTVPLPFQHAVSNLREISWKLGTISEKKKPKVLMKNVPVCANCHSFSSTGKDMAMDVDYANDKGNYAISTTQKRTKLTPENIISWSHYNKKEKTQTFGLLAQISPDGRYAISTVRDRSIFVAKNDLKYSQLFFPVKGILAVYDRKLDKFYELKGANNKDYVQSNPVWSPDGKYIYFARAKAIYLPKLEQSRKVVLPISMAREFIDGEKDFKFDIYRIPFNNGIGGKAEPLAGASGNGKSNFFPRVSPNGKWMVFTQSENFMLLQPDSKLYIMPASGGTPRLMKCNNDEMNSWHSWSPNSKWLVFSSKQNGVYTQLYLTHIDEKGNDSPAIHLENLSSSNLAANIPEFINTNYDDIDEILPDFLKEKRYSLLNANILAFKENKPLEAIDVIDNLLKDNNNNHEAFVLKGDIFNKASKFKIAEQLYSAAIKIKKLPKYFYKRGLVKTNYGNIEGAIKDFEYVMKNHPEEAAAYTYRGYIYKNQGNVNKALNDFNRAIKLFEGKDDLDIVYPYYYRAGIKENNGDLDAALADYSKIEKIDPADSGALLGKAMVLKKLGKKSEATEYFNKVIQVGNDEEKSIAKRNL